MPDHTDGHAAGGRVLRVNLGIIKFGTDDKSQAVALILSIVILTLLMVLLFCGPANDQTKDIITAFKTVLLITIGVAVGNGGALKKGD